MFYKNSKFKLCLISLILIIVLVFIDQFTKMLAVKYLMNKNDFIIINNVLQLHYLENNGAAFSMLKGQQLLFKLLTPVLIISMYYIMLNLPTKKRYSPLNYIVLFMIAGAIGNYIDRVINEYVIDFIYFSLIDFPVFNVADIYVTCSVIILIILIIFYYKEEDFDEMKSSLLRKG